MQSVRPGRSGTPHNSAVAFGPSASATFTDMTESRRDQEDGGELDSLEVRHFCGSRRDQEEGGGAGPAS